jgi:hypothetical protein
VWAIVKRTLVTPYPPMPLGLVLASACETDLAYWRPRLLFSRGLAARRGGASYSALLLLGFLRGSWFCVL